VSVPTGRGLAAGFGLAVAVLAADAAASLDTAARLADAERQVTRSHERRAALAEVLSTLKDAETGQRGYLLTGRPEYLEPYTRAAGRVRDQVGEFARLAGGESAPGDDLAALRAAVEAKLAELDETVRLRREQGPGAALRVVETDRGQRAMDDVRRAAAGLGRHEDDLLRRRAEESRAGYRWAVATTLLASGLALGAVGLAYALVRRDLLGRARAAAAEREQRERLRVTLASIGDGVIATDTEGRVTLLNPVAEALTGWGQPDAAGRPLEDVFRIVNELTRKEAENPVRRVLREGRVVGLANHTALVARDGTERPIDDSAAPIRDGRGRLAGVVLVFRDVSERRRAEEARRRLAAVVESSEDAIVSKTLGGVITSWNGAAERLFGYTAVEAVGRPVSLLAPPERPDEMPAILERVHRGERVEHYETVRVRKDGTRVHVSLSVSPVKDASGRIVGAAKIARDTSERRRLEGELRRRAEDLAEADRRKTDFIAVLAHELRGPLAPIRNCARLLLLLEQADPRVAEAAAVIERQAGQVGRLIDDLLEASRAGQGKLQLRKGPVELAAVVGQAVEACRPALERKGQRLAVSLPAGPVRLSADPARLVQVFGNLLTNASKYTDEGGQVWVAAEAAAAEVVVRVRDSGVGIPAELLPRVFDLFAQAGGESDRSEGGLGIGLAVVKGLVELHGGSVEAHSEGPGRGSEFVVRLPTEPAERAGRAGRGGGGGRE
jgi:PAS domain S-box-containing protein